jgi:hypothetical protein
MARIVENPKVFTRMKFIHTTLIREDKIKSMNHMLCPPHERITFIAISD